MWTVRKVSETKMSWAYSGRANSLSQYGRKQWWEKNKRGGLGPDRERSGIALKQIVGGDKDKSNIFQSVSWKALIKSLKHRLCPHCPLDLVPKRPSGKSTFLIYIF